MRHELQFLRYEGQGMQLQQEVAGAKHLYTTAKYLEKQENNHQKTSLMLGSKNLVDRYNSLSLCANWRFWRN